MGYSVTRLEQEPVVLIRYEKPYDAVEDAAASARAIGPALGQVMAEGPAKAYLIFDLSDIEVTFTSTIQALGELFSEDNAMPTAEQVAIEVEALLIGDNDFVRMAAQAVTQEQYGANDLPEVFASREAALGYVHEDLQAVMQQ